MRSSLHAGLLLALGVCAVPPVCAQQAQRSEPHAARAAQTRPRVIVASTAQFPAATTVSFAASSSVQTLLTGNLPVPGLGFDFVHAAAMNAGLDTRALIDPVTQHRLALAREIARETPIVPVWPVFLPASPVIVVQAPPPVVVIQQAAPAEERLEREVAPPVPSDASAAPPAPLRELDAYVLVRRDASVLYAVAFTVDAGRVIYITREGLRRSLLLANLDSEATLRMNEEQGTPIRLFN